MYDFLSIATCLGRTCALRAPTAFSARIKGIRAEKAVTLNPKRTAGVLSKIADCARMAFHPRAIGDPRGRFAVRATAQLCSNAKRNSTRRMEYP
jgi:hypothetical protein